MKTVRAFKFSFKLLNPEIVEFDHKGLTKKINFGSAEIIGHIRRINLMLEKNVSKFLTLKLYSDIKVF